MAAAAKTLGPDATLDQLVKAYLVVIQDILPPGFSIEPPPPPVEPEQPPPPVEPPTDIKQYHAIVQGGFFSADPYDKKVPTSIRCNNPGALNTSKNVAAIPGYNTAYETSAGNRTAIFWAPEYGVLAYWDLLKRYRASGAKTVHQIISKYGGGQDYSAYEKFVVKTSGLPASYEIKIDGSDDANLMKFAKAMFRYESGRETPLSDAQIKYGFSLGRERERMT
jgi:hypothetical protein